MRRLLAALLLAALGAGPEPAAAGLELPSGFRAQTYVTGEGFGTGSLGLRGLPSSATLTVDEEGALYLARTGRRYGTGEQEDVFPVYRIPPGGARLTPSTEARFLHGPPLPNPQLAGGHVGGAVMLTTYDRLRGVGVVYRLAGGRVEFIAGGGAADGGEPVLRQPEGAVADADGTIYVADRRANRIVALDADGRVRDAHVARVPRPRLLARGPAGELWVGADGEAEAPWLRGPGEIWRVTREGARRLLSGPLAAGLDVGPGGTLYVADRQGAEIFVLGPDGERRSFARFSDGDAPRGVAFAPVTPATRRAGIAGDLFVIVINRGAWPVNEVLRISGPFDRFRPIPDPR